MVQNVRQSNLISDIIEAAFTAWFLFSNLNKQKDQIHNVKQ